MICDCKKHILNKRKMCARNIRPTENVKLLTYKMTIHIFKIEIKIAIVYRRLTQNNILVTIRVYL